MPVEERICPVRAVTGGPKAHFFGYYDKPPWDASGRFMLALEAEPLLRMPRPGERAGVCLVELETGRIERLAETAAWNWQQGAMLQWMPGAADREVVFNDVEDGRHVAVVLDVRSGARRALPRPVYSISPDGKWALSTSFARLADARAVVGYAGVEDPFRDDPAPAGDGIWRMDLRSGESELVVPLDTVARFRPSPTMAVLKHRFEHVVIAPDGRRFFFLHRWPRAGGGRPFHDRLFTANADGTGLFLLAGDDLVSHFDWRDPEHLLAWARRGGEDRFWLFRDRTDEAEIVGGGLLARDGHCSYSPDRRWILSDCYPDAGFRLTVLLYEVAAAGRGAEGRRVDVGRFATRRELYGIPGIRCDLHPRWSRDGSEVCIDSAHEGARQMYVIDVSEVTGPRRRSSGRGRQST